MPPHRRRRSCRPAACRSRPANCSPSPREYVDAGRFDAAERLLGHILAAAPQHGETLHLNGYIAFKRNKSEEAAALMEHAMAAGARAAAAVVQPGRSVSAASAGSTRGWR